MPSDFSNSSSPSDSNISKGPVGAGEREVLQGECLVSIAHSTGLAWQTIWNHPSNSSLKSARKDPNVLLPGDLVHIPDVRPKEVSRQTDQFHLFKIKRDPCRLKVAFSELGQPRANEPYVVHFDDQQKTGKLDGDGLLDIRIPPTVQQVTVILNPGHTQEEFELAVGALDPANEITGLQARLENLGYDCGGVDGECDDEVRAALADFQKDQKLDITGSPDEATCQALLRTHKCG
jgi:hypothetical protein